MMRNILILFAVIAGCFLITPPAVVMAGQPLQPFTIETIGTTLLPAGCNATAAVGTDSNADLQTQYDLSAADPAGQHYARLLVYTAPQNLGAANSLLSLLGATPDLYPLLSGIGKNLVTKKLEENGLKLIEWLPASATSLPNHAGIQLALRATLPEKLPLPMYAVITVYPRNNQLTAIALVCPDVDKKYWQPVYAQMLSSLKEAP